MRLPNELYYAWSLVDLNDFTDYMEQKKKGTQRGKTYTDKDLDTLFTGGN